MRVEEVGGGHAPIVYAVANFLNTLIPKATPGAIRFQISVEICNSRTVNIRRARNARPGQLQTHNFPVCFQFPRQNIGEALKIAVSVCNSC